MNYIIEKVWKINGSIVVAPTIEDAITIYSMYLDNNKSIIIDENSAIIDSRIFNK